MIFYLGCHQPLWLELADVPWFLSYQKLRRRQKPVVPAGRWALDSGGFTEIDKHGEYTFTPAQYAAHVEQFRGWGGLDWCASMDWPCSEKPLRRTGLTIAEHQGRTVQNFRVLREEHLGEFVKPVLQGWARDDYMRHVEMYAQAGYDLHAETTVCIGSLARGAGTAGIAKAASEVTGIVRPMAELGLRLHALGVKGQALQWLSQIVVSADSMAWSFEARGQRGDIPTKPMLKQCVGKHKSCGSCIDWALVWRERYVPSLEQLEMPL